MPKIDLARIPLTNRTGYPPPYDEAVAGRWYRRLAPVAGLTRMGASHVVLQPGAWSSQRHWHREADELVIVLQGEAVLVEDGNAENGGETVLRAGDVAAFPRGVQNGHHLQNRGEAECVFVVVSAGEDPEAGDSGGYSAIDMLFGPNGFTRRDGSVF